MKLVKLSVVAVMALGTSAFAIDNVKVNGEAKLWYQTSEYSGTGAGATTSQGFFDNTANSSADVKLSVGATADLLQNLSAGVKVTAISTLGLENNLVGSTTTAKVGADGTNYQGATSATTTDTSSLNDQAWVEEAYLAYTAGKTTAKIGRQALNTPLAFTETWNVVDNTFEAVVLLNNDLPDTTLVGAWIGKHNGVGLLGDPDGTVAAPIGVGATGYLVTGRNTTVAKGGTFSTFGTDGAYAAGAINKSIANTALQAWYYNVPNIADAYWLQADTKLIGMISVGAQYAGMNPDNTGILPTTAESSDVFALKAGVDITGINIYAAYSTVSTGALGFANVATGDKSSVYTTLGSIYMDGEIAAAPDTDAWKIGASTKMVPGVALSASYAQAEQNGNGTAANATDFTAWDVTAATKVGAVDLTAIYTQFDKDVKLASSTADKTTDTFRVIASLKF